VLSKPNPDRAFRISGTPLPSSGSASRGNVSQALSLKVNQFMVPSYSEYIRRYIHRRNRDSPPSPGEHHFVSTYLLPRLYELNGAIPDYVNPDGTKSIIGDVVYYRDEKHHFGIEVKLGTVRLTKREFNNWIVDDDRTCWPDVFIGVGKKGIALTSWSEFRNSYVAAVVRTRARKKKPWSAQRIQGGYGPMKEVDELAKGLGHEFWFPLDGASDDDARESRRRSRRSCDIPPTKSRCVAFAALGQVLGHSSLPIGRAWPCRRASMPAAPFPPRELLRLTRRATCRAGATLRDGRHLISTAILIVHGSRS
jgi:hypothetical protein